ncbi:FxsA family protein [Kitasatospora sp. NBC_01287]|uniref:FxsA family membrane protein n=1 Tax=Kitasatospora sp. NBC_01287 TaxID=2903573 RepID=UPI002259E843|nr:FxsA family membrane protein [Kitasatospora sp. NBC_01287]MCX4744883.1 FxsA family protein [Kitasatospora sp. NBC_01287]
MTQHANPTPRAGRPNRLRRFVPLLLALWLVLEIWLLIKVASVTGWLLVLLLLLLGLMAGFRLIKKAGLDALRAATAGTPFEREVAEPKGRRPGGGNAGLTALAGLLLVLPGFLSDLIGLTMLVPPTRELWRAVGRRLARRAARTAPVGDPLADALRLQEQLRIHRPDGKVVQGEVVDPVDDRVGEHRPQDDEPRPPLGR